MAALIGYLVAGLGQNRPSLAASVTTPAVPPTPTVARAVTFTPTVIAPETPTVKPTTVVVAAVTPSATRGPGNTPSPSPKPTRAPVYYVVQSGDTIEGISNKFGVSEDAIIRANNLDDPNTLSLGQKLVIPK
ncbi:MAG TPA: LysM peptidoglycan-binding domain-containing protein [Chloroflexota bacterium]|nr:LysM peptidoglycan-binding domain-containing protein [Chloroflexota bacterium]